MDFYDFSTEDLLLERKEKIHVDVVRSRPMDIIYDLPATGTNREKSEVL